MGVTEIVLLGAGGIIFILSFLIPARGEGVRASVQEARKETLALLEQEFAAVRGQVDEAVEEAALRASEKTERALERLSNEKIMAVNEYSDTVLAQIHKDHEEAMFLYDMLNSKQSSLKNMMSEINRTVKEAESAIDSLQKWTTEEEAAALDGTIAETLADVGRELLEEKNAGNIPETADLMKSAREQAKEETREEGGQKDNFNEEILALFKQGKSEVAIAKELGLGVGVVQLVCNLYKGRWDGPYENQIR